MKRLTGLVTVVLLAAILAGSANAAEQLRTISRKDELDVLRQAVRNASSEVINMRGLRNSEFVGVLIVRGPQLTYRYFTHEKDVKWYDVLPVIPWFITSEYTLYTWGSLPNGEREHKEFSHSPMLEDLIVESLVNAGRFSVIETIEPFYGDIEQMLANGQTAEELLADGGNIANIGKVLGVDTMIIGSAAGSVIKEIRRENYISIKDYFVADISINVRTVDVETGVITDATTVSGLDSCPTWKATKAHNIAIGLAYLYLLVEDDDSW